MRFIDDVPEKDSLFTDELKTMRLLIDMGYTMEDSLGAMNAVNSTDLTVILDTLYSQQGKITQM